MAKSKKEEKSIPLTQIHDRSLSWLGTDTSITNGGIKLVLNDIKTHYINYIYFFLFFERDNEVYPD
jgi:penicillin-binding protein-related factor A (putative recombinase)